MIRFTTLILIVLATAAASAQPAHTPQSLLTYAESLVAEANDIADDDPAGAKAFELEAAAAYRELIGTHGIDTAAVHRNLGIVELRLGNLGRAIASLKRAAARAPTDRAIRDSLDAARGRVRTAVEPSIEERAVAALLFWRDVVPRRSIFAAALACWSAAWLVLAVRVAARRAVHPAVPGALFGIAVVAAGSLVAERWLVGNRPGAVVIVPEVEARRGPSADVFETAFDQPLREGTEGTVLERRGGWLRIRLSSNAQCWIPESAAEEIAQR